MGALKYMFYLNIDPLPGEMIQFNKYLSSGLNTPTSLFLKIKKHYVRNSIKHCKDGLSDYSHVLFDLSGLDLPSNNSSHEMTPRSEVHERFDWFNMKSHCFCMFLLLLSIS